mgnify:CR=1 FL=1
MIALVTGIAIAAFDVFILAVCIASFNSSATLSGFSKTVPPSGIPSNLCTKKRSKTHWFSLLFEICERRISLGVNSTPTFFVNGYMIKGADLLKIVGSANNDLEYTVSGEILDDA